MTTLDKKTVSIVIVVGILVSAVALSQLLPCSVTVSGQTSQLRLHVDGKSVVNSNGNVVVLHGVNFEGYELTQYQDDSWSQHTLADYQEIASLGFNVVRLPISWQHIEPAQGAYDSTYFTNYVDRDIAWAAQCGIYVILSFQQWYWSPYFTSVTPYPYGLPSWMFSSGYPNTQQGESQSITDFWAGKAPNGAAASSSDPSMQDRMISAWQYIATRYKNNSAVLGYDLFNEPPSGTLSVANASLALYTFLPRLISSVSSVDSNHIFIYEPIAGRWDYFPQLINTPNTVFSVHIYPFYNDATTGGYSGNKAVLESQVSSYLNQPSSDPTGNWNIPIFIGEFGPSTNPFYSNDSPWVSDMADVLNEHGFSWAYWDYSLNSGDKFSIVNPDRTLTQYATDVVKPYVVSSSVASGGFSFNENTSIFSTSFSGSGQLQAQIYLPSTIYQNGFSITSSAAYTQVWNAQTNIETVNTSLQPSGIAISVSPSTSFPTPSNSPTASPSPSTSSSPSSPTASPSPSPQTSPLNAPSPSNQPTSSVHLSTSSSLSRTEIIMAVVIAIVIVATVVAIALRQTRKRPN